MTAGIVALLLLAGAAEPAAGAEEKTMSDDPYRWLEEVDGTRAQEWVSARNRATERALAGAPEFERLRARLLEAFDSEDRIPDIDKLGEAYYNFWRDADNPRGVWRRASLAEYRREDPAWETVLDLDKLAREEDENWVLGGFSCRRPDYGRCLAHLSRGGADAAVVREFDMQEKRFVVPGEGGFALREAKSRVAWAGPDSLFVATDFGPGTMTDSGYPRIVKEWRRGQPLADAPTVFEGRPSDVSVQAWADLTPGFELQAATRAIDFHNSETHVRREGEWLRLPKPDDARAHMHRGRLFLELKSDWNLAGERYAAGSLLATDLEAFLTADAASPAAFAVLFAPTPGASLDYWAPTRNHVLLNVLENVRSRVAVATPSAQGWSQRPLAREQGLRTLAVQPVDPHEDDRYFLTATDFLTPATLALAEVGAAPATLKRAPAQFDAAGLVVAQHWATSADGARIPYFQVSRADHDGPRPTLLYGYGGFEIPLLPRYSAGAGIGWLERGGVYAVANIRGGGEFGPAWHQAALKENRGLAYADFIAVAEDLARRKIATAASLGILGGSNGGLLMGNMLTMRPDLFGAIVAQVPLFDMRRYHELLAGASWIAEFGDPDDPDEWRFLRRFSPYHNVREDARYPPLLIVTSTRDDRVHPGHARKMTAKLQAMGHAVAYYENVEGGHGGAADNAQSAFMWALAYEFLWRNLSD